MVNMAFWKKNSRIDEEDAAFDIQSAGDDNRRLMGYAEHTDAVLEGIRSGTTPYIPTGSTIPVGKTAITEHLERKISYLREVVDHRDQHITELKKQVCDLDERHERITSLSRKLIEENEEMEKVLAAVGFPSK